MPPRIIIVAERPTQPAGQDFPELSRIIYKQIQQKISYAQPRSRRLKLVDIEDLIKILPQNEINHNIISKVRTPSFFGLTAFLAAKAIVGTVQTMNMTDKEMQLAVSKLVLSTISETLLTINTDRSELDADTSFLTIRELRILPYVCANGTFQSGSVYVQHPMKEGTYLSIKTAHPNLLEDKRAEAVALAASLGAKSIRLLEDHSNSSIIRGGMSTSIPETPIEIEKKLEANINQSKSFSLETTFENVGKQPHIPNNLYWFEKEPMWKAMAHTRINFGAKTFKLDFSYNDDFNINSELTAKIAGYGLSVGGDFVNHQQISQTYHIEFHPLNRND